MANPMMQMLRGSGSRRPNNPIAMMAEFRKFAANMTHSGRSSRLKSCWRTGPCLRINSSSSNSKPRTSWHFLVNRPVRNGLF